MGDQYLSVSVAIATLVGVAAGPTRLPLAPRDDGPPGALHPTRIGLSRGGEQDFFRDVDDPVAPNTLDAVRLDERDFITALAMM